VEDQSAISPTERKYRVFLSYSHEDINLVRAIDDILAQNRLLPMWDEHFSYGQGFHDQIKNYIAHAHVFLPVLTHTANNRNWVHQEIGYAMALNVPVLPVAIGEVPGEMIYHLHAIRVAQTGGEAQRSELSGEALERLKGILTTETIGRLVDCGPDHQRSLFACADFPEARAAMMARYCEDVRALGQFGLVRQKGALSSFHIPLQTINHKIWRERYGRVSRSDEHCRLQRLERIALTRHAVNAGCKLIINPYLKYEAYGRQARYVRLKSLYDFLREMPDEKCQVTVRRDLDHEVSNTYVGDWFSAESVSAVVGKGYFQTIFTRHAALLQERIATFDCEFAELLAENGISPEGSRRYALEVVGKQIAILTTRKALAQAASS
jgi:hypothetical protein